MSIISLDNSH